MISTFGLLGKGRGLTFTLFLSDILAIFTIIAGSGKGREDFELNCGLDWDWVGLMKPEWRQPGSYNHDCHLLSA